MPLSLELFYAVAFVVPAVQALRESAEGADIHVTVGPIDTLVAGLLNGDFDHILSRLPAHHDSLSLEVVRGWVEEVRFMMRAGHPLATRSAPVLQDLAGIDWVIQAPGRSCSRRFGPAFRA